MFRRKEEGFEEENAQGDILAEEKIAMNDNETTESTETTTAAKPAAAPAAAFRPQPAPAAAANRSVATSEPRAAAPAGNPKASKRVLTVGHDIHMKGEISTCDRLVIEGSVDATLKDVHTVELAQTGSFKGTAEIEDAEISGIFEGDLIVHGRLIIYATGQVKGSVSYGEIEVERGGKLSGTIKTAEDMKAEKSDQKKAA